MMDRKLKWSSFDIIKFLDIYKDYESLWDINNENYRKKTVRNHSFSCLIQELVDAGIEVGNEEVLKKKIKILRDAYRNEVKKVKKSMKNGIQNVHKPKLVWFDKADSFLRNIIFADESILALEFPTLKCDNSNGMPESNSSVNSARSDTLDSFSVERGTSSRDKRPILRTIVMSQAKKRLSEGCDSPISNKKTTSRLELAVSKLHKIAEQTNTDTNDQYTKFGNHVAAQLRELPLRSFIILQEKIQSLITHERLGCIES